MPLTASRHSITRSSSSVLSEALSEERGVFCTARDRLDCICRPSDSEENSPADEMWLIPLRSPFGASGSRLILVLGVAGGVGSFCCGNFSNGCRE
ncbi:hypothetical protein M426DRAFT_323960 [Hypoxylon sp. CI-4A]|nr:hypothetical protein M426DRAFT_323960 [Hypoxylon sp. CI-4A]